MGKDYPSGTDNPTVPLLFTASRARAAYHPESNIDRLIGIAAVSTWHESLP
jgi:hypothetical protein